MNKQPDRRDFLKTVGLGSAALSLPGCINSPRQKDSAPYKRPHILYLMTGPNRFYSKSPSPGPTAPMTLRSAERGEPFVKNGQLLPRPFSMRYSPFYPAS